MFCVIYRSSKRDQTYLYVEKKDDFSRVPEALMKGFGQPQLAMMLPLDGRKKLVNAELEKVKQVKRRTKNAKAFHDKCENFSFRASNETDVLITAFYSLHGDHLGYG